MLVLFHMALGAGALVLGRFGYLASKKGGVWALAKIAAWWGSGKADLSSLQADIAALKADMAAVKAKVGA